MTINQIIERAVRLYIRTGDLKKVQSFLDNQNHVPADLLLKVSRVSKLTLNDLLDESKTGDSWGLSREMRPQNTWNLIKENFLRQIKASKADAELWAENQLSQRKYLGKMAISKKDSSFMGSIESVADAKKFAAETLSTLWKKQGLKLARRSAEHIEQRYVETEARGAILSKSLSDASAGGFKWCYIPKTEKGHLDECRDIEGKWYRIGVDQIPKLPLHINCKHKYVFTNLRN